MDGLEEMARRGGKRWADNWSAGVADLFPPDIRQRVREEARKSAEGISERWARAWSEAMRA